MTPVLTLFKDPALRMIAALMVLLGAVLCSFAPYVSVLAVHEFKLGNRGYAALMVASTIVSVGASVYVGIRADQTASRRAIAIWSCALLMAGAGVMTLRPGGISFVLAHGLILPVASTLFGQLFAQARLVAQTHPPDARDNILAVIRALFALPFILVLPLWSVAFSAGASLLSIYPAALTIAAAMLVLTLRSWPKDGAALWQDRPSGLSFGAALGEIARGPLAMRVLALGAVTAANTTYMALVGLVLVADVGRTTSDVALYAGLVAGLEVPFMLIMPYIARRLPRTRLILIGTAIYCGHVVGLPLMAGSPLLWGLILPAALGGAIILTLPIAYLQDLMADRPGTGASLMALQRLTGDILAAVCFVIGTTISGYGMVAALGAATAVFGALALHLADRPR